MTVGWTVCLEWRAASRSFQVYLRGCIWTAKVALDQNMVQVHYPPHRCLCANLGYRPSDPNNNFVVGVASQMWQQNLVPRQFLLGDGCLPSSLEEPPSFALVDTVRERRASWTGAVTLLRA